MSKPNLAAEALWLEGDVDHVNPEKFAFRQDALKGDERRAKMLDLYAGVGYLASRVYLPAYREVVAVEKDDAAFRRLVRRVGRFANVRYYHKDNAAFVAEDLRAHLDFSAADFDSFGAPGELVIAFFAAVAARVTAPFLLLMTDGGLMAVRRRAMMNLRRYYLVGPDEARPVPADLADHFEGLQKQFIARLAARYGFASEALPTLRNHNQTVLYSAYVITPGAR